ncbi:hypothetical protein C8R43DRAFT_1085403 [Mycena crocata]|nr:hypothetical protein C8R43DRAFT_1085403 [Mycena crocata]
MDSAANCDKMAVKYELLVPAFSALLRCLRCFCHILNLTAKRKKVPKASRGTKRKRGTQVTYSEPPENEDHELVLDKNEQLPEDEHQLAQTLIDIENEAPTDNGEQAHDDAAVRSIRGRAIAQMRDRGVEISDAENKMVLGIFPKVSGLARRVNDSATLGTAFSTLVQNDPEIEGDSDTLTRRVPTRWNSDLDYLESHLNFRGPVESLTAVTAYNLKVFQLTEDQWTLADCLSDILYIFKPATKLFSRKEVPLVHEVIPMMEALDKALKKVENATDMRPVFRVAAGAALLVLEKYHSLSDECEVHCVAIVMCPDRKLEWFVKQGWETEDIDLI